MGFLLGIDEAGKGPVIGPLIIAGVLISKENSGKLRELGVKDSKDLSPGKRNELFSKIKELSEDFIILETSSKQLNEEMELENLNTIEIKKMVQIINSFESLRTFRFKLLNNGTQEKENLFWELDLSLIHI